VEMRFNSEALAGQFRAVWDGLPSEAREVLGPGLLATDHRLQHVTRRYDLNQLYGVAAPNMYRAPNTQTVYINARATSASSDPETARYIIAHELAHVYNRRKNGNEEPEDTEDAADTQAAAWGFQPSARFVAKEKKARTLLRDQLPQIVDLLARSFKLSGQDEITVTVRRDGQYSYTVKPSNQTTTGSA
jgi:hypothetical protein